jgi:hypothetical protein
MEEIIDYHKDMDIRNTEQLFTGLSCTYLEVLEAHEPGVYIAVQWRRKPVKNLPADHRLLKFNKVKKHA